MLDTLPLTEGTLDKFLVYLSSLSAEELAQLETRYEASFEDIMTMPEETAEEVLIKAKVFLGACLSVLYYAKGIVKARKEQKC